MDRAPLDQAPPALLAAPPPVLRKRRTAPQASTLRARLELRSRHPHSARPDPLLTVRSRRRYPARTVEPQLAVRGPALRDLARRQPAKEQVAATARAPAPKSRPQPAVSTAASRAALWEARPAEVQ